MVVMALQKMFSLMLRCSIIRAQTSASLSLSYHLHRTLSVYQRFQRLVTRCNDVYRWHKPSFLAVELLWCPQELLTFDSSGSRYCEPSPLTSCHN
jgi:hypothetical protein